MRRLLCISVFTSMIIAVTLVLPTLCLAQDSHIDKLVGSKKFLEACLPHFLTTNLFFSGPITEGKEIPSIPKEIVDEFSDNPRILPIFAKYFGSKELNAMASYCASEELKTFLNTIYKIGQSEVAQHDFEPLGEELDRIREILDK